MSLARLLLEFKLKLQFANLIAALVMSMRICNSKGGADFFSFLAFVQFDS